MPYVAETTLADIVNLSFTMRDEDKAELLASSGRTPRESLEEAFSSSTLCYSIFTDDHLLVGIFGVAPNPFDSSLGHPWLLATDLLPTIRKSFLRECHAYVAKLSEGFQLLVNCCDKRNVVHIKWLKWLGFTFIKEHSEYGVGRIPFMEFVKLGK